MARFKFQNFPKNPMHSNLNLSLKLAIGSTNFLGSNKKAVVQIWEKLWKFVESEFLAKFWYILPWKASAPDDTLILGIHYRTINGFLFSAKKKENWARIRDRKQVIFSVFPLSTLCQNADDSLLCSAHRVFSTLNLFNILKSDGDLVFLLILGELVVKFVRMGGLLCEDLLGKPNV